MKGVASTGVTAVAAGENYSQAMVAAPLPHLQITALGFVPHGTGQTFDVVYTITNNGGSACDPDTTLLSVTNATPTGLTHVVPSLAVGASVSFTDTNETLNAGAQNAPVTLLLQNVNVSRNATYSRVTSTGNSNVDATFSAFLLIAPPLAVSFPPLAIGPNTLTGQTFNVKSNTNYEVDLFDANANTNGHLSEWNGTSFVPSGKQLTDPLNVASSQHTVLVSTSLATLVTGGVAGQSGDAGQNFSLTFNQQLHYADALLPAGESYHLVVTFNGFVTL